MPRVAIRVQVKRPVKITLDTAQIVQAALQLLDEVGLDGLTMRRLAERLNIKAASLYWHVRDKDELIVLLANEICASAKVPDPALSWRVQLMQFADDYRRLLLSHRDGARVMLLSGPPSGANRLYLTDLSLGMLLKAGFAPKDAAYAGILMNDYITTFVMEETRFTPPPGEEVENNLENWIDTLTHDQYPNIAALAPHLLNIDMDDQFHFGVGILLDGLAKRLAARG